MVKKIVTMGEILLRLTTPGYSRFTQARCYNAVYGGAEANIAVFLANMGIKSYFLTRLPENEIGQSAINILRSYGVNTDYIIRGGERVGIYFLEKGTSIRPSKVVYDRKNSSICDIDIQEIDFEEAFKDADWFHVSGITPALGEKCVAFVKKAIEYAKNKGIRISVDLNYRNKLWEYDEFKKVMAEIVNGVDLCFGWINDEDKKGYSAADFSKGDADIDSFKNIFSNMQKRYNIKYIATTLRGNYSATHNVMSALIYDGKEMYQSRKYDFTIIDRVGAGDAFAAALIYKLANDVKCSAAIEFATAASVLKHTIEGDFNICTEKEIMEVVNGNISGSVQR